MSQSSSVRASAIIPAYNEAERIADVLHVVRSHPLVDEVIVVSDGSTDGTASIARRLGAVVIEFPKNRGKGDALGAGVAIARNEILAFFDADLQGLTHAMIDQMLLPVLHREYDMFTLVRDRQAESFQLHIPKTFVVGGERVLRKSLWNAVPTIEKRRFCVELALNYFAERKGLRMGRALASGLKQFIKEKKRGLIPGLWLRMGMVFDCLLVLLRLRVLRLGGEGA
jgi:glycosyltransferase involved in cell wall biosynthesis